MADLNLARSFMQRLEEANKSPGPGDAAGGSVLGSCLNPLPVGSKLNLDLVPVHSLVQILGPINARRGTRNLWFWLCAEKRKQKQRISHTIFQPYADYNVNFAPTRQSNIWGAVMTAPLSCFEASKEGYTNLAFPTILALLTILPFRFNFVVLALVMHNSCIFRVAFFDCTTPSGPWKYIK
jgi:hypothetical protein